MKKPPHEMRGGWKGTGADQETWLETSLVISNMDTAFLPLNTSFSLSSAL